MLSTQDQQLLQQAQRLIETRSDGENHTVAAVARDINGNIYQGVNLYHFTGGPCAEPVVMAVAATSTNAALEVIVAVGDRQRGVLAPCGRCRQMLFDYFPDIEVLVPDEAGVQRVPIKALLPYTYDWRSQQES